MLTLLLVACGASLADRENDARAALDARDWAKARSGAEAALPDADPATAWRLQQIRMDALAGEKNGAEILRTLAAEDATRANGAYYRALADKLKTAGDNVGAIDVLDAGLKRFPEDAAAFQAQIDLLKVSGDPEEIERLKALGYL